MARGKVLSDKVDGLILWVKREHPKWKAPQIRGEVNHLLRLKNRDLPKTWPSLSAVQKTLARANAVESSPLDESWSSATLDKHPLSSEGVVAVFRVWHYRIENNLTLSIREAKWVARLAGIESDIPMLARWAWFYARTERIYELMDRDFDSEQLDRMLMGLPVTVTGSSIAWMLAQTQEDLERGIKDGVQQVIDIVKDKTKPASNLKPRILIRPTGKEGRK